MSPTWDPAQYLRFADERTRPSVDLAARVALPDPRRILDVGCGPGNSTRILRERWPAAAVAGMDSSQRMIEDAKASYPLGQWILADAAFLDPSVRYELVFSNAALQWIPDHERLIPALWRAVEEHGALAVQVPANRDSPLHQALLAVAAEEPWRRHTAPCRDLLTYHDAPFYYGLLSPLCGKADLWETTYFHEMESRQGLLEWYKGTGMRPYLESLPDDGMRKGFEGAVLARCADHYPAQNNGKVLFPFRRLFFIAYR
jgi:trans-aconitate 2-methyltransferase